MLNVNVNVKCKCSVYMSDLRQNITIFTVIHSSQSRDYNGYLAGKMCRPTVDIVEQCNLLNYDRHQTQIIPQSPDRDIEKKITFKEPVIPMLHPLIFVFL